MKLQEVLNPQHERDFIQCPVQIYESDKNWIRPLDRDVLNVFNPKKNNFFKKGAAKRWVLKDDNEKLIGRIAAFHSSNQRFKGSGKTGGIGFFECIDNENAANSLFDIATQWLRSEEVVCVDGPINFGERDRWWGLLIEGFSPPVYCTNYNPPYYQKLFENYGFQDYFRQFTYYRRLSTPLREKTLQKAQRVFDSQNYRIEPMKMKSLDKYAIYFQRIFNQSWAGSHSNFKAMSERKAKAIFRSMSRVMEEDIIIFTFYKNEPIAFFLNLPDINQIVKNLNGKLDWWGKLKFLWHQKTSKREVMMGLVFGVIPEFQGKGVDAAMAVYSHQLMQEDRFNYKSAVLNWIGDFNPKMITIVESLDFELFKTHITYRKMLDESIPFERHKVLN